ncbi:AraC family transcriptional regulator [Paraglaciecola sp. 20A4]|uniref:AraC family transcriptional regulator n=1 Tax=Paraglaciecola sp. 20A4 TaxID=2687288 RepID=UPI00140E61AA|nr:AraC family transcriptional regulator [Paraglaciecola sp. 20A4]
MRQVATQLIPIIYSRVFAQKAGQTKEQMKEVLRGTGVDDGNDKNSAVGMTVSQYRTLLANAQRVSGDKYIAFKAAINLPATIHGPVGIAATSCATLQDALELNAHYGCLRLPFSCIEVAKVGRHTRCVIDVDSALEEQTEPAVDFFLSGLMHAMILVSDVPLKELHLELKRPKPADALIFESLTPCPVRYDQNENALVILTTELERGLPGANTEVYRDAIERCDAAYSLQYIPTNEVDEILDMFVRMAGQVCTIQQITQNMGMSARTLQRRLKLRGVSFQILLDDWLAKQASKYLLEEHLTVEVTSVLLGYSDEANFRRAFKRWYGLPAGVYRERGLSVSV